MTRRLTRWQRISSAGAAIVAGGGGLYGVFEEGTNTGGVPVLLAVAAFLGYLAISGQRLSSVKVGDSEARFERIADRVTREVLEDPAVPTDVKGDVAEAIDDAYGGMVPPGLRRTIEDSIADAREDRRYRRDAIRNFHRSAIQVMPAGTRFSVDEDEGHALMWTDDDPGIVAIAVPAPADNSSWVTALLSNFEKARQLYPASHLSGRLLVVTDAVPEWGDDLVRIDSGLGHDRVSALMVAWRSGDALP